MCIVIVCKPGYEAMNFEVNMIKKSWQEIKYLENEKSFQGEIKSIFYNF